MNTNNNAEAEEESGDLGLDMLPVQYIRHDAIGRELQRMRYAEMHLVRRPQTDAVIGQELDFRARDDDSTRSFQPGQRYPHRSKTSQLLSIMLRVTIGIVLFATTFACSSENTECIILLVSTFCTRTLSGTLGNTCLLYGVSALAACSLTSQRPLSFEAGNGRYPISPSANSPIVMTSLPRGGLKNHSSQFGLHDLILTTSWIRGRLKRHRMCSGLFCLVLPGSLIMD